jgi:hypothetical protein
MILTDIWFIGMIVLVIFQQGVIIWLTRKVINYGQKNLLCNSDNRTYTCNDRNRM